MSEQPTNPKALGLSSREMETPEERRAREEAAASTRGATTEISTEPAGENETLSSTKPESAERRELTLAELRGSNSLGVEILGDFSPVLTRINEDLGVKLQPRAEGYHMTVIDPTEREVFSTLSEEQFMKLHECLQALRQKEGIRVLGLGYIDGATSERYRPADREKKTCYLAVDAPALQQWRTDLGLPPKDFHLTLGFEKGDIHQWVVGKTEAGKESVEPIPKKADPTFNRYLEALPTIEVASLSWQQQRQAKETKAPEAKKIVAYDSFRLLRGLERLVESGQSGVPDDQKIHSDEVDKILVLAKTDPKQLGRELGPRMRIIRDVLQNAEKQEEEGLPEEFEGVRYPRDVAKLESVVSLSRWLQDELEAYTAGHQGYMGGFTFEDVLRTRCEFLAWRLGYNLDDLPDVDVVYSDRIEGDPHDEYGGRMVGTVRLHGRPILRYEAYGDGYGMDITSWNENELAEALDEYLEILIDKALQGVRNGERTLDALESIAGGLVKERTMNDLAKSYELNFRTAMMVRDRLGAEERNPDTLTVEKLKAMLRLNETMKDHPELALLDDNDWERLITQIQGMRSKRLDLLPKRPPQR